MRFTNLPKKLKFYSPVLPKKHRHKPREESPKHLPAVTVTKFQKTEAQLRKTNRSESTNLTPRLKYQNTSQQANVSQLNRLVSREVFYKINKQRRSSDS
jgi:hypothetical protein